jgi:formylmethanofuran dehydrogenase subunit E
VVSVSSLSEREATLRSLLVRDIGSPSLDADLVEYRCPNCSESCINPRGSVVARANVCVPCYAAYLATGSTKSRIARRTLG